MENHLRKLIVLVLASLPLLSACSMYANPTPGPLIPGLAQTLAAQTLTAQEGSLWPGEVAVSTHPPPLELPAESLAPTSTPEAVNTPVALLTPFQDSPLTGSSLQKTEECTNVAEFIKDVSIPDDSMMRPKERFIKTWQFKNAGTCTWTPDYAVLFIWGHQMGGKSPKPLGQTVAPGQFIEISTELQAPKESGGYQGSWIFQDPEGNQFGTGYKAKNLFWVSIVVADKLDRFFEGAIICGGGG